MKKDASPQRTQFIMMFFAFAFGMILSNLLSTQSKNKEMISGQEILFIYRGIEKTLEHITESDRTEIVRLNESKIRIIERAALRQYFSDEAHFQGISAENAIEKILKWDVVSDSEINSFYQKNKDVIKKPFFEVKPQIKRTIELQRASIAREKLLEKLKIKGDLAILPTS